MMLLASSGAAKAQDVALKTNLLGWATTSLNAGVEVGIAEKQTAQLFATLNPWEFSGGKKVRIWNVEPEYRWWTCQRFGGSFFGEHALAGEYNVKNVDLPFGILPKTKSGRHYEGWYIGAGVTYGYQWLLSRHWNGLPLPREEGIRDAESGNGEDQGPAAPADKPGAAAPARPRASEPVSG